MSTSGRRKTRFEPVSRVLASFLDESGLTRSLARLEALDDWNAVVGPRIGAVTRAVEVRRETLVVEVLSSAWLTELTMMSGQILERINRNEERPAIDRIRFRLAESPDGFGSDARPSTTKTHTE